MTAYNRELYITEAIDSVLASDYNNFELIIVDDCSNDSTAAIAQSYSAKDHRIKVYVNDKNLDQFPNRNRAAGYAKGYLLMSVDSDDIMNPDAIEYIVEQFNKFPNAQFATIYGQEDIHEPVCLRPEENIRKHFFKSNHLHVGPGGTIIKRTYFYQIGGFPVSYGPAGDSYYNIKAAASADTLLLPYRYYTYRVHQHQEFSRKDSYLLNNYLYFQDVVVLPELALSEDERKGLLLLSKKKFLINMFIYYKRTKDFKSVKNAWRKTGFGVKEMYMAMQQFYKLIVNKKLVPIFKKGKINYS